MGLVILAMQSMLPVGAPRQVLTAKDSVAQAFHGQLGQTSPEGVQLGKSHSGCPIIVLVWTSRCEENGFVYTALDLMNRFDRKRWIVRDDAE